MNIINLMNMKKMMRSVVVIMMGSLMAMGQGKTTDQRMEQDIEVAENILGTLLRQGTGRKGFFPVEVKGSYVPGYGVTFRLPLGSGLNRIMIAGFPEPPGMPSAIDVSPGGYTYSYSRIQADEEARHEYDKATQREEEAKMNQDRAAQRQEEAKMERDRAVQREKVVVRNQTKAPKARRIDEDSLAEASQKRFMEVAKSFMADYGDVISGLKADEKIVITNRSDDFDPDFEMMWWSNGRESRRQLLSVEARRGDVEQLKQGKISRADFMSKLKVVSTETAEALDPDLEVFSSMFGRLYREDLSHTYYVQGNINYERLKDYGVMYYMKVYSSIEMDDDRFAMPTVAMRDVDQTERDKKVKELYPKFESELKENIVEYGRTLRSLKDEEQLVFNVRLTKCEGCGIPSSLELSIKSSALKDYSSGKATKEATLAKMSVKKKGVQ